MTFDDAIANSKGFTRHLLLGNGFSIACNTRFDYKSLLEASDFPDDSRLPKVFDLLDGTKDFEKVIKRLEDKSEILPIYSSADSPIDEMTRDAEALKDILIKTITYTHPSKLDSIDFPLCRKFLSYFLGSDNKGGNIYTLNYDLLLYWATGDNSGFLGRDGFWHDSDSGLIIWESANAQSVYYLHGALHLYYKESELRKHQYNKEIDLTILQQVRSEMSSGRFPLFVAEGESEQKLEKIRGNEYLCSAYGNFKRQMKEPNDALFIFGHSLDKSDKHILDCITKGTIRRVYVDLFGDPNSESYKKKWALAKKLDASRKSLKVKFFQSETANVWG